MFITKRHFTPALHIFAGCAIGMLFLLAFVLRVSLYHVETSDYTVFVSQWYDFIQTHDGFAAFKYNFSNYNVPYLYLLALTTYLPIPKLIAIKTLSVVFDGVLGLFTYLRLLLPALLLYSNYYATLLTFELCTVPPEHTNRQPRICSIRRAHNHRHYHG